MRQGYRSISEGLPPVHSAYLPQYVRSASFWTLRSQTKLTSFAFIFNPQTYQKHPVPSPPLLARLVRAGPLTPMAASTLISTLVKTAFRPHSPSTYTSPLQEVFDQPHSPPCDPSAREPCFQRLSRGPSPSRATPALTHRHRPSLASRPTRRQRSAPQKKSPPSSNDARSAEEDRQRI